MPSFLHVGCGGKGRAQTTPGFNAPGWSELRLDIDPRYSPDFLCSMTDMRPVPTSSVDAVYSAHNLEHLHPDEIPVALSEFARVLKPDGFCIISCPDLQAVAELVAQDRAHEVAYTSPIGPITAMDMLFGFRGETAANPHMAHRWGFTLNSLTDSLLEADFGSVAGTRREAPAFDLWALATRAVVDEAAISDLCAAYFPAGYVG